MIKLLSNIGFGGLQFYVYLGPNQYKQVSFCQFSCYILCRSSYYKRYWSDSCCS